MRGVSAELPKALIPVLGKPFILRQLELLRQQGVRRIVYSIGYLGAQIRSVLESASAPDVEMLFVDEGDQLRGTGGAVRLALDKGVLEDVFFVLYGDSYLPVSFEKVWEFFESRSAPALMTVYRNHGQFDRSNARFDSGGLVYDKKGAASSYGGQFDCIDYGLSIVRKNTVERIPAGVKFDLAELFTQLSRDRELLGYEVTDRFYEAGSPQGLKDLEAFLQQQQAMGREKSNAIAGN